ncbi:protein atonal homolog 8 [Centrocercus urophasianus]|uniref:protein atonal homolog 8 n=1 Tax=Centrocercus urophasianus TaxID=9002 RepID=UPI001C64527D|nr:protein atonal homolog 8 [Centrocercus urophasianus]
MRSTPLAEGEPWPRLCPAAELGGLRRLRRKHGCKSFRVELKVLSGRRSGLRAPPAPPPPPPAPPPAWEPRGTAALGAAATPRARPRDREGHREGSANEKALESITAARYVLHAAARVPCYSYGQKLSKLAILRIACNYILSLARLADLDYSADHSNMSFSECVEQCTRTLQAEGRSKKRKEDLGAHVMKAVWPTAM